MFMRILPATFRKFKNVNRYMACVQLFILRDRAFEFGPSDLLLRHVKHHAQTSREGYRQQQWNWFIYHVELENTTAPAYGGRDLSCQHIGRFSTNSLRAPFFGREQPWLKPKLRKEFDYTVILWFANDSSLCSSVHQSLKRLQRQSHERWQCGRLDWLCPFWQDIRYGGLVVFNDS